MNYNIRGERLEVTEALREYVEKKLSRLEKYFSTPLSSDVIVKMKVVRDLHHVEVSIPFPGGMLRAEVRNGDMYAAIDLVIDKLEGQIRKHKTKVNRKLREDGGLKGLFKDNLDTSNTRPHDEEDDLELVRTKRFTLKPMDIEEAILQMNMVGHSFFVFANMDTEEVNVVYRRNDGKYGLIEPAK